MRIAIARNSVSGKSTLAAALAAAGRAPSLDLDTVAWEPGRIAEPRDERLAREDVSAFCRSNERWIVEGAYTTLIETALLHKPALLFLNPGLETCLENCRARPWEPHKYASKDDQDAKLQFLLDWVRGYYTRSGPLSLAAHTSCFRSYAGPKCELRVLPSTSELRSRPIMVELDPERL